ncbi:MAG: GNAT family N-acetyltransferase [Candidatus Omnitrophota bacterium]
MLFVKKILAKIILFLQSYAPYRKLTKFILYRNITFRVTVEADGYKAVAMKNNRAIAKVFLGFSDKYSPEGWWLQALGVKVLYRRLGIGRQLVIRCIDFIKAQKGACIVFSNVHKDNIASMKLFSGLNFKIMPWPQESLSKTQNRYAYIIK